MFGLGETYITEVNIKQVRHLKDITINLSNKLRKNLIITGKNGSGKTSVSKAIRKHLELLLYSGIPSEESIRWNINDAKKRIIDNPQTDKEKNINEICYKNIESFEEQLRMWTSGAVIKCTSYADLKKKFNAGQFIIAEYSDDRSAKMERYNNIEHIELKERYEIDDNPGQRLVKYLVNMKATQAFAMQSHNLVKVNEIDKWFNNFENILKKVFDDESVHLNFDINDFQFTIEQNERLPFDFNTLSSGYSAIFDIINDLIMRMEKHKTYELEGIVLVDEIETHLHLNMQRKIMPILTELFPRLQFIVTTHSPFILNSVDNAVIYDLENKILVQDGLNGYSYEGILKGYFYADNLSDELKIKFSKYKELVGKDELSNSEYAELESLEYYLDKVPDYLALDFTTEYNKIKLEFNAKEANI